MGDLYRDRMTLRQLWVRFKALPIDAPIWYALDAAREAAAAAKESSDIDDVLAQFQRPKGLTHD